MSIDKIAYSLLVAIASVVILIYLESILIPFIFSIIIWLLMLQLRKVLRKSTFIKRVIPNWMQNMVAFIVIFGMIFILGKVLATNVQHIVEQAPTYLESIETLISKANKAFGIDLLTEMESFISSLSISNILTEVFNSLSSVLSNIFLVLLYVLFLLSEEAIIPQKLKNIYQTQERFENMHQMLREINHSISSYIALKTLVSLLTGALSYVALAIIGVDFPVFWAILIFLLNYIPTIGSLIGTVFPSLMALLQFGELTPFLLVLGCVGAIQLLIGNYVEPKMMGNSLNISSLVVLLALAFWGSIWGVVGMILSVPVTVMIMIVFSKFESTRSISIWLSGDGGGK